MHFACYRDWFQLLVMFMWHQLKMFHNFKILNIVPWNSGSQVFACQYLFIHTAIVWYILSVSPISRCLLARNSSHKIWYANYAGEFKVRTDHFWKQQICYTTISRPYGHSLDKFMRSPRISNLILCYWHIWKHCTRNNISRSTYYLRYAWSIWIQWHFLRICL